MLQEAPEAKVANLQQVCYRKIAGQQGLCHNQERSSSCLYALSLVMPLCLLHGSYDAALGYSMPEKTDATPTRVLCWCRG